MYPTGMWFGAQNWHLFIKAILEPARPDHTQKHTDTTEKKTTAYSLLILLIYPQEA